MHVSVRPVRLGHETLLLRTFELNYLVLLVSRILKIVRKILPKAKADERMAQRFLYQYYYLVIFMFVAPV